MDEHTSMRLTQYIKIKKEDGTHYFFKFPDENSTGQLKNTGDGNFEFEGDNEYYTIKDKKTVGTDGGTFDNNTWVTRDLNTLVKYPADSANITLSSNQFTLKAGSYKIKISAPAYRIGEHQCRLYNVTTSSEEESGTGEYADKNQNASSSISILEHILTITSDTIYKVEHKCSTKKTKYGLGLASGHGNETYTTVVIRKIS